MWTGLKNVVPILHGRIRRGWLVYGNASGNATTLQPNKIRKRKTMWQELWNWYISESRNVFSYWKYVSQYIYIYIFINLEKNINFQLWLLLQAALFQTSLVTSQTNKHSDVNIYRQCQCWKLGKIFRDSSFRGPDRCLWVLHHKRHRPSTT